MRRAFAVLAVLASVWSALAWVLDGIALSIGPLRISSSHSIRPLIVAAAAAIIYIALCGPKAAGADLRRLLRALTPRRVALQLTTAVIAVGIANNSWAVGGSDSYSYASQMDLWLDGDMKVPVTMATEVPWPDALATFTPFGYTAVAREMAIAPITPPGRPLLMAAFKSIGSHAAAFLVVPLTGGLLAWSTFLLGRRLGSDRLALAGAWLVATSPTFLMMFKSQMSDVPGAAFWTLATYLMFGTTVPSAVAAGVAASLGSLIRPNLLPLAAVLAGWTVFATQWRVWSHLHSRRSLAASSSPSSTTPVRFVADIRLRRALVALLGGKHRRHDLVVRGLAHRDADAARLCWNRLSGNRTVTPGACRLEPRPDVRARACLPRLPGPRTGLLVRSIAT